MNRRTPALSKASGFLAAFMQEHPDAPQLPALRILAQQADVSLLTMQRAVNKCVAKGIICKKDNGRLAGSRQSSVLFEQILRQKTAEQTRSYGVERVYNALSKQIRQGTVSTADPFPPVKYLASQLGANSRTIARAFARLEAEGVVERYHRAYTRSITLSIDHVQLQS